MVNILIFFFFLICELGFNVSEILSQDQAKILIYQLVIAERSDTHVLCEQGKKHPFREGYF